MTKLHDDRAAMRAMSEAELVKELHKERRALATKALERVFGKLSNHRLLREHRKRIARLATILTERITHQVSEEK